MADYKFLYRVFHYFCEEAGADLILIETDELDMKENLQSLDSYITEENLEEVISFCKIELEKLKIDGLRGRMLEIISICTHYFGLYAM
jgi:hypothetical protein